MEEKTRPADQIMVHCDSVQGDAQTSTHAALVFNIMHTPLPPSPMLWAVLVTAMPITTLVLGGRGVFRLPNCFSNLYILELTFFVAYVEFVDFRVLGIRVFELLWFWDSWIWGLRDGGMRHRSKLHYLSILVQAATTPHNFDDVRA